MLPMPPHVSHVFHVSHALPNFHLTQNVHLPWQSKAASPDTAVNDADPVVAFWIISRRRLAN